MRKRINLKKRYLFSILFVALIIGFSNSFQFRMSDSEVISYFGQTTPPEVKYLEVGQRTVRYLWQNNGHKTTVILVHGAPGSSSAFIDFFHNQDLRSKVNIISIDRLGYGYSGYGEAEPSLESQAEVIQEIVADLSLDHVILLGHSLGAPIIARAALENPKSYAGLVMVAGSMDPDQEPVEWYRTWLRNGLAEFILPASLIVTNEEIYFLKDQLLDLRPELKQIEIPLIVIQGESDQLVPMENATFIQEHVASKELEVWLEPQVNHFIPWNRPDLIVDGILKLEGKL
ncbi:MAG: alpha/beta hydrolase [Reichenbachiella sp.]|uniref:alpha/beta fold hydrolase n=1 Tax=Reichenbachiella sp. TaxID=2184521 RepID=UPI0032663F86